MFGITGAHRSGKTTLAKALAEKLEIEFLETNVSGVFKDLGIDPKADMPFAERLEIQNKILKSMEVQYELRRGKLFIADRTPFDVLGYTMADIQRGTLDEALRSQVYAQVALAEKIIADNLIGVILLPPLPNPEESPTSAQACPLYMHHVYCCIRDMIDSLAPMICKRTGLVVVESQAFGLDHRIEDSLAFLQRLIGVIKPEPKLWTP